MSNALSLGSIQSVALFPVGGVDFFPPSTDAIRLRNDDEGETSFTVQADAVALEGDETFQLTLSLQTTLPSIFFVRDTLTVTIIDLNRT